MKRFVLLGAGASTASDFHLPVMSGFFEPDDDDEFSELFSFLASFYPRRCNKDYNLEEVLAFLDISRTRLPAWGLSSVTKSVTKTVTVEELYLQVLKYIAKRLKLQKGQKCGLHERLFGILSEADTIVTLNYDLVADQTLLHVERKANSDTLKPNCRIGKLEGLLTEKNLAGALQPPSLMPDELEWGFYLKLHGSLDWLYCPTVGCRNHINIFAVSLATLSEGQDVDRPCRFCGTALRTMIVPPVIGKRFQDIGRLAFLWNLALTEMRDAQNVVIIGVSLAPTDFDLRWLIREGVGFPREHEVHVDIVNPNDEHQAAVAKILPENVSEPCKFETIENYLVSAAEHAGPH